MGPASRALCVGGPRDTTRQGARFSTPGARNSTEARCHLVLGQSAPTWGKSRARAEISASFGRARHKIVVAPTRIDRSAAVLIGTSLASIRHMTTANLTSTDIRLRDAVMRQLAWDPEVDASAVGVSATKGTVTLTGLHRHLCRQACRRACRQTHCWRARGSKRHRRTPPVRTN